MCALSFPNLSLSLYQSPLALISLFCHNSNWSNLICIQGTFHWEYRKLNAFFTTKGMQVRWFNIFTAVSHKNKELFGRHNCNQAFICWYKARSQRKLKMIWNSSASLLHTVLAPQGALCIIANSLDLTIRAVNSQYSNPGLGFPSSTRWNSRWSLFNFASYSYLQFTHW